MIKIETLPWLELTMARGNGVWKKGKEGGKKESGHSLKRFENRSIRCNHVVRRSEAGEIVEKVRGVKKRENAKRKKKKPEEFGKQQLRVRRVGVGTGKDLGKKKIKGGQKKKTGGRGAKENKLGVGKQSGVKRSAVGRVICWKRGKK